jgi:hypothetical protein
MTQQIYKTFMKFLIALQSPRSYSYNTVDMEEIQTKDMPTVDEFVNNINRDLGIHKVHAVKNHLYITIFIRDIECAYIDTDEWYKYEVICIRYIDIIHEFARELPIVPYKNSGIWWAMLNRWEECMGFIIQIGEYIKNHLPNMNIYMEITDGSEYIFNIIDGKKISISFSRLRLLATGKSLYNAYKFIMRDAYGYPDQDTENKYQEILEQYRDKDNIRIRARRIYNSVHDILPYHVQLNQEQSDYIQDAKTFLNEQEDFFNTLHYCVVAKWIRREKYMPSVDEFMQIITPSLGSLSFHCGVEKSNFCDVLDIYIDKNKCGELIIHRWRTPGFVSIEISQIMFELDDASTKYCNSTYSGTSMMHHMNEIITCISNYIPWYKDIMVYLKDVAYLEFKHKNIKETIIISPLRLLAKGKGWYHEYGFIAVSSSRSKVENEKAQADFEKKLDEYKVENDGVGQEAERLYENIRKIPSLNYALKDEESEKVLEAIAFLRIHEPYIAKIYNPHIGKWFRKDGVISYIEKKHSPQ